ncbi:MAG: class I SAM-dependent methyltransferase [Chthoniobacterales bacterium]
MAVPELAPLQVLPSRGGWFINFVLVLDENDAASMKAAPSPAGAGYDWKDEGEEWSAPWGCSASQWAGTLLPRIHEWVPTKTILELAPGFGRWTHYLEGLCLQMHLVDFQERCIAACRRRFAEKTHLHYHHNDGESLAMIADGSIDFLFSFDSLVHAPRVAIESYVRECGRILRKDGVGFIHHSNLGAYARSFDEIVSAGARRLWTKMGLAESNHSRVADMTAELFRELCATHGLQCIRQERINWRGRRLLDCISTFVRTDSKHAAPLRVWDNYEFMREAEIIRQRSQIYPTPLGGRGDALSDPRRA